MGGERVVKIVCRANPAYVLAVMPCDERIQKPVDSDIVILRSAGPDPHQLWVLDNNLIDGKDVLTIKSKANGLALTVNGPMQAVSLTDFETSTENKRGFWILGPKLVQDFYPVQSIHNPQLTLDVARGRMEEGASVVGHEWKNGFNQMWALRDQETHYTLRCKIDTKYALSANLGETGAPLAMASVNEEDPAQVWAVKLHPDESVTISNFKTGLPMRATVEGEAVRLAGQRNSQVYTIWHLGVEEEHGFVPIQPVQDTGVCIDAVKGEVASGCGVILHKNKKVAKFLELKKQVPNQLWGFFPVGKLYPIYPV